MTAPDDPAGESEGRAVEESASGVNQQSPEKSWRQALGLGLPLFGAAMVLPPLLAIAVAIGTALVSEVFRVAMHRLAPALYAGRVASGSAIVLLAAAIFCLLRELTGPRPAKGSQAARLVVLVVSFLLLPAGLWLFLACLPST